MLKLYDYHTAVCAQKIRLVLAEKHLDWERHNVDLKKDEQNNPEYLKLNPNAVVPTLVHDGRVIIESAVIAEYLDEEFVEYPLQPDSAYQRALMRIWTKKIDDNVLDAITVLSFCIAIRELYQTMTAEQVEQRLQKIPSPKERQLIENGVKLGIDAPEFPDAVRYMDRLVKSIDQTLADGRTWLLGEQFTLADLEYIPYLYRLEHLALDAMFDPYPHFKEWYQRLKARPSFTKAYLKWDEDVDTPMFYENGKKARPKVKEILGSHRSAA